MRGSSWVLMSMMLRMRIYWSICRGRWSLLGTRSMVVGVFWCTGEFVRFHAVFIRALSCIFLESYVWLLLGLDLQAWWSSMGGIWVDAVWDTRIVSWNSYFSHVLKRIRVSLFPTLKLLFWKERIIFLPFSKKERGLLSRFFEKPCKSWKSRALTDITEYFNLKGPS